MTGRFSVTAIHPVKTVAVLVSESVETPSDDHWE